MSVEVKIDRAFTRRMVASTKKAKEAFRRLGLAMGGIVPKPICRYTIKTKGGKKMKHHLTDEEITLRLQAKATTLGSDLSEELDRDLYQSGASRMKGEIHDLRESIAGHKMLLASGEERLAKLEAMTVSDYLSEENKGRR